MNSIRDYKFPKLVTDQNTLEIQMEKMNTERQTKPQNVLSILKLVMSFLL